MSRVNDLIWFDITAFFPAATTFIEVSEEEYPIPALIISTSVSFPLEITGLSSAPVPEPELSIIFKSGVEKYSLPWNETETASILPFTIVGFNEAFLPFFMEIIGFFSKFIIEDP